VYAVPGNGFGQKEGTFHIRLTFLPDEDELEAAMDRFEAHHKAFVAEFSK
jgi:aspartate/methionine/tyrosine aminotransferase